MNANMAAIEFELNRRQEVILKLQGDIAQLQQELFHMEALKEPGPCGKHPKACWKFYHDGPAHDYSLTCGPECEAGARCTACEHERLEVAAVLRDVSGRIHKLAAESGEDDGPFISKLGDEVFVMISDSDAKALDALLLKTRIDAAGVFEDSVLKPILDDPNSAQRKDYPRIAQILDAHHAALIDRALDIALRYRHGPIDGVDLEAAMCALKGSK